MKLTTLLISVLFLATAVEAIAPPPPAETSRGHLHVLHGHGLPEEGGPHQALNAITRLPPPLHATYGPHARAPSPAVTDGPKKNRSRWFPRKWADGYCGETDGPTDCSRDAFGSIGLQPHQLQNWSVAWSVCRSFCLGCARCQYIAVSRRFSDCSWYAQCDLDQLKSTPVGFRSRRVRLSVPPALPQPQAAWTTEPYQQARASTNIRVCTYDFERAWSSRNRIGLPNSMQPFGPEIDEFGTTAASGPTYTTAVLALAAALRTSQPEEATLFFLPSPSGVTPQVDDGWCSRPHSMFSKHWKGTTDYFRRRGGHDHVTAPRAQPWA